MAKDEARRVAPNVIEADRNSFAALQAITNYQPANPSFSMEALTAALSALNNAQRAETQALAAAASARDAAVKSEWEFHNIVLGMRDQVIAQFGRDSNEIQAVGLKKVSEHKRRGRKAPEPTT